MSRFISRAMTFAMLLAITSNAQVLPSTHLRPVTALAWQRVSPTATGDGPVLYQLIFRVNSSGASISGSPNQLVKLQVSSGVSSLVGSSFSDNGVNTVLSSLSIADASGVMTFAPSQTFPKLFNTPVASTAPTDGQVLAFSSASGSWTPVSPTSSATASTIVMRDANGGFAAGPISGTANSGGPGGTFTACCGVLGLKVNGDAAGSNAAVFKAFGGGNAVVADGGGVGIVATGNGGSAAGMFNGDVGITGNTSINGNLNVLGSLASTTVNGSLSVSGNLNVSGTKAFRIDDPLDPANKYLVHASIESSEMLNLYSGNIVLDHRGAATVTLPKWFQTENTNFRYSLTAIGRPCPGLYIAEEIKNGHFQIGGGSPGAKVSWQIIADRSDPYAETHPLVPEQEKGAAERGHYVNPEFYGRATGLSETRDNSPR